jgi:hypothetical protein
MHIKRLLLVLSISLAGCASRLPSLSDYRTEGPDRAIEDLPSILPSGELRDGTFEVPNTEKWFRIAQDRRLIGKPLDAAIAAYGHNYLISSAFDPPHARVYYKLAGTHSWGVYGVLILDERLKITAVTTDPR